ncbi:MAG: hypothetical protein RIB84_16185 [Sneathiellaceae bacterium]
MRKPAGRFLKTFLLGLAGVFALVLAVTLAIDPYGLSPLHPDLGSLNATRLERKQLDRMIKPIEAIERQPRTLLIGTSRVRQGFDPDDFADMDLAPVYNLGINFSSLTESIVLLEAILPFLPSVETIVFEFNFVHYYFPAVPKNLPTDWADLLHDGATAFLSVDALAASVRTVLGNRSYFDFPLRIEADGMMVQAPNMIPGDIENFYTNVVAPGRRWTAGSQQRDMLGRLREICDRYGIHCIFAVLPYLPADLAYYDMIGNWPALVASKRDVMQHFPVLDLTMYNRITTEPLSGQMAYWTDVNHFTPLVGSYIADRLAGRENPEIPENFGIWLTEDNFEARMAEWQDGLEAWKAANPEPLRRIRETIDRKAKAAAATN